MSLTLEGEAYNCNEFHSEILHGKSEVCYFTYTLLLANMLNLWGNTSKPLKKYCITPKSSSSSEYVKSGCISTAHFHSEPVFFADVTNRW